MKHIFFCLSIFFILSCTSKPEIRSSESTADLVYQQGKFYLENNNYEEAEMKFLQVITNYSFSKYEPYATVGLADTYYKREEYLSALELYERFLKMRPNHDLADYATFQVGNCHFEQRPSDFFFLPAPDEKDITMVQAAADLYRTYLKRFPSGKYHTEAKDKLREAESMLITRELKVARFYLKKEKCPGVMMRINFIRSHFTIESKEILEEIEEMEKSCKE